MKNEFDGSRINDGKERIQLPNTIKRKSNITIGKCSVFFVILILLFGYIYLVMTSDTPDKGEIGTLYSTVSGIAEDEEEEVLFFVEATSGVKNKIELYKGEELVGIMKDDGSNGDRKANDGCYSLEVLVVGSQNNEFYTFKATLGDQESNEVKLYIYDDITDEDIDHSVEIKELLEEIEYEHRGETGFVSSSDYKQVILDMRQKVEEYADSNGIEILMIEEIDRGLFILFSSGIQLIYEIEQPDVEAGGSEVYLTVRTLEPYLTQGDTKLESFSEQAEQIDSTLGDGADYDLQFNDLNVTSENILAAFKPESFIIWHGHGGYADFCGSVLATGIESSDENIKKYKSDIQAGRMVQAGDRLAITYKYFDQYVDDLSESFVYLGACETGHDKNLMDVMIWKNAEVSVGFSYTVYAAYDSACVESLTNNLCTYNEEIDSYMYFEDAFSATVKECGANDFEYFDKIGSSHDKDEAASIIYSDNSNVGYHINQNDPQNQSNDADDGDGLGDKVDDYIDDKIDDAENKLMERLEKWLEDLLMQTCGGCI